MVDTLPKPFVSHTISVVEACIGLGLRVWSSASRLLAHMCTCASTCVLHLLHLHRPTCALLHTCASTQVSKFAHLLAHTCVLARLRTCASSALAHLRTCTLAHVGYLCTCILVHLGKYLHICAGICTLKHLRTGLFVLLNWQIFVCQMDAHSVCPGNTLTWLPICWFNAISLSATHAQS